MQKTARSTEIATKIGASYKTTLCSYHHRPSFYSWFCAPFIVFWLISASVRASHDQWLKSFDDKTFAARLFSV